MELIFKANTFDDIFNDPKVSYGMTFVVLGKKEIFDGYQGIYTLVSKDDYNSNRDKYENKIIETRMNVSYMIVKI